MHISKDKLTWIQLDITARCQAMCLECARNIDGKDLNPLIGKANTWDMPLEIFQKAVTPSMLKNSLNEVVLNGNFGDPCIHPNFIDICKYVIENAHSELRLKISTNGAMFDVEYWTKIGKLLAPLKNHRIIFGIDGLSDTHSIYRRNTKFEDVIRNAKAFINAGGHAIWQFIIFNHNKHQTEEAKKLAEEIGFTSVFFKGGFNDDGGARNYVKAVNDDTTNTGAETKKEKAVDVSITERKAFKKAKDDLDKAINKIQKPTNTTTKPKAQSKQELLDTAKITCQWYETNGMYIEYDGSVWMCCWIGDIHKTKSSTFMWKPIQDRFGIHFNNLNYYSFDDILSHEFFVNYLDKTFNSTTTDPDTPRIETCAKTCIWGKTFV